MELAPPPSAAFASRLLPGEQLLWSGRPASAFKLGKKLALEILAEIAVFAGIAYLAVESWTSDGWPDRIPDVWLLVTVLLALTARTLLPIWRRSRLVYAVTNRRVLILRLGRRPRLSAFELGLLPLFQLNEHQDGTGSILFDEMPDPHSLRPSAFKAIPPAFEGLADPQTPYRLIRRQTERLRDESAEMPRMFSFID